MNDPQVMRTGRTIWLTRQIGKGIVRLPMTGDEPRDMARAIVDVLSGGPAVRVSDVLTVERQGRGVTVARTIDRTWWIELTADEAVNVAGRLLDV